MNTPLIKNILKKQKIIIPLKKNYKKLTKEKAYILGVLAGDGYVDKNIIKLEIRRDIDFIKEFANCLYQVYGSKYTYYYYPLRNSYIIYAASQIIYEDLLKYGDFRTKTWKGPKIIMNSNKTDIISKYLNGLYDSEGSPSKYKISFSSDSKNGIIGVHRLLNKLNIQSRLYKLDKAHKTLEIMRKPYRIKFRELIGFSIKRKMDRLLEA